MSRPAYDMSGVIRISDDSSTESDAGLDSDFHSSPESLMDDDVVIVDAVGLPADDRGEACDLAFPLFTDGEQAQRGEVNTPRPVSSRAGFTQVVLGRMPRPPHLPCTWLSSRMVGTPSSSRTQG